MFTSSLAWTSSPASVAITSFAFMFEEVPEPVWKTSIGNWSSSSPAAIRSAAAAMRSALSASSSPSSAFTRAAAALIRPSQRATGTGIGSPETWKFPTAFVVSPPQSCRRASVAIERESTQAALSRGRRKWSRPFAISKVMSARCRRRAGDLGRGGTGVTRTGEVNEKAALLRSRAGRPRRRARWFERGAGRPSGNARICDPERHVLGGYGRAGRVSARPQDLAERSAGSRRPVVRGAAAGRFGPADRHGEDVPDPGRLLRDLPPRELHTAGRRDARGRVGAEQRHLPGRRLPQQLRRPDPGDGLAGQLPAEPVRHQHLAEGGGCVLG